MRDELRRSVALHGPKQFLTDVAAPLVEQVGQAWATGRIAVRHEHLISQVLSNKLRQLLSAYDDRASGPVVLLTTLSDEQHGLGLEMVALYLALEGATPRLLGVNTPPDQIAEAAVALSADVVGVSISEASDLALTEAHLRRVLGSLPNRIALWVGGKQARNLTLRSPRVRQVVTWSDLDEAVARFREAARPDLSASVEDDGLVAVLQHAIFQVQAHGARQDHFFQIAPLAHQVVDRVAVRAAHHVLLDDRPFVQHRARVVGGGADQLHAALVGLVVRLAAHERGQERVVDVDDLARENPCTNGALKICM